MTAELYVFAPRQSVVGVLAPARSDTQTSLS